MFRSQASKQMVSKPTHDSGNNHRPCLCLSNNKYNANSVIDCYYSDHDFILCTMYYVIDICYIFCKTTVHM